MSTFKINTNKLLVINGVARVRTATIESTGISISGASTPSDINGIYCDIETYNNKNKYIKYGESYGDPSYYIFWSITNKWVISSVENSTNEDDWYFVSTTDSSQPPTSSVSWTSDNTGEGAISLVFVDCSQYFNEQSIKIIP
jgi:hypothetical protein